MNKICHDEIILQDKVLEKLRSDATVSCTKPANSEPCKPLQQVIL